MSYQPNPRTRLITTIVWAVFMFSVLCAVIYLGVPDDFTEANSGRPGLNSK